MTEPTTEVAVVDPGPNAPLMTRLASIGVPESLSASYISLDPDSDVLDVVIENLGGDFEDINLAKLPRVKFPTGGDTTFNVPDASNPNGVRQERRLTGIMVISQPRRAYWPSVDLTGTPPSCFAIDGKTGEGDFGKGSTRNPSGKCKRCPMAVYGSKAQLAGARSDDEGQACKQTRLVHLLVPGAALPMQLSIPPASLKVIEEYLMGLAAVGTPTLFYGVEVELSLNRAGTTNPYAELAISTVRVLNPDEVRVTKVYAQTIKAQLAAAGADLMVDEVSSTMSGDGAPGFGDESPASAPGADSGEAATESYDEVPTIDDEQEAPAGAAGTGAGTARTRTTKA